MKTVHVWLHDGHHVVVERVRQVEVVQALRPTLEPMVSIWIEGSSNPVQFTGLLQG